MTPQEFSKLSREDKVKSYLKFFSSKEVNRFSIFYNGEIVLVKNKLSFKTEGIARGMLIKYIERAVPNCSDIIDKYIKEGIIEIKQNL